MARRLKSDRILFTAAVLLVSVSVVMVYSASAVMAADRFDSEYLFLAKQALWTMLGLAALAGVMRVDYRRYQKDWVVWLILGVVALALGAVLVMGTEANGAQRWLYFGPVGLQPSEFAKLAVVLFTALFLARRMHRIDDLSYSILPIALITTIVFGLIVVQPDYGTAVSILLVVGVMVFAAGISARHLTAGFAVALPILALVLVSAPYRRRRLSSFVDPWADRQDEGWQLVQSLIAVGSGGTTGRGLGDGVQKLFFLPEPHTDFIYAVIGEEFGLIGTTIVLVCFGVIAWRGFRIALRAQEAFGAFLALGLTTMICAQALMNISITLGLLPTTGIPLPLVSAGGSSLLVCLVSVGVLLNVSQHEVPEPRRA